jgi:hypothetical protein
MSKNKLTFESENIVVDYLSFKFQHLEDWKEKELASYLLKLGFNCYKESGKLRKPIKTPIFIGLKNIHEACFVVDNPYWQGTVVTFSGLSAKFFYMLLQEKKLRGEAFSDSILGRFDIYYRREDRKTDKTLPEDFLEACHKKVRKTNQNVSFEKNQKGLILKLGNRKGNNYCRIYKEKTSLKFEYEMKGQLLRKYHSLLISNCLEELENLMCEGFLRHFGKLLPLEESFTDWLVVKLRPLRKQKLSFATFHSHYLEEKKFSEGGERKKFFMLLQFLNYAQNLDYERGALGSTTYRQVIFQVKDFLEYQKKSNNYYQLKKLIEFFDELQTNSLIKFFSDKEYRSLVTIPEVALTKGKQNCWVGRVWISEELFRYSHPFILPNLITKKLTKHEVEVQFKVIQVFSSVNIAKTFWIKDFFEDYSVKLTNQQKTKMKNYFIECLQQYKEHGLVDGNYKIISKGKAYSTKKLTSKVISEGFIVYEKLYV